MFARRYLAFSRGEFYWKPGWPEDCERLLYCSIAESKIESCSYLSASIFSFCLTSLSKSLHTCCFESRIDCKSLNLAFQRSSSEVFWLLTSSSWLKSLISFSSMAFSWVIWPSTFYLRVMIWPWASVRSTAFYSMSFSILVQYSSRRAYRLACPVPRA